MLKYDFIDYCKQTNIIQKIMNKYHIIFEYTKEKKLKLLKLNKISTRLNLSFNLIIFTSILLASYSIFQLNESSQNIKRMYDTTYIGVKSVLTIKNDITEIYSLMQSISTTKSSEKISTYADEIEVLEENVFNNIDTFNEMNIGNKDEINELKLQFIGWKPIRDEIILLSKIGMLDVAERITHDLGKEHLDILLPTINDFSLQLQSQSDELLSQSINASKLSLVVNVLLLLLVIIISYIVAHKTHKYIVPPINSIKDTAFELSQGNLNISVTIDKREDEIGDLVQIFDTTISFLNSYITEISDVLTQISNKNLLVNISKDYKGDFYPIKKALNNISTSLNQILVEIKNSAEIVTSSADNVKSKSFELRSISDSQSSSAQILKDTIKGVSYQAKLNSDSSKEAYELSKETQKIADDGSNDISFLVTSMNQLNDVSTQIQSLMDTIESIARETNILAINATIESARAGQYGSGFAVVANEVKMLAEKSSDTANNTRYLITDSLNKIKQGTLAADKTAESFLNIVDKIQQNMVLSDEIYKSSSKQSILIEEINDISVTISDISKQASDISEINSMESFRLTEQAFLLNNLMKSFNLNEE